MIYSGNIKMKELAIVILNYNGRKHLETYLPAVVEYADAHTIVVIDNASTDDSCQFILNHFFDIQLIKLETNFGFAKGYNEGLKHIQGEFRNYLLLNSDVEPTEGFLTPLLLQINKDKVAAVQPKILSHSRKTHFEHAGAAGGYIDRNGFPFCRGRIFGECEKDQGQYNDAAQVFWASGACMMVKANLYHTMEGFDNTFYAHMEEIDLCWRMQKAGYEIWVAPSSAVYHLGGGTLAYDSPKKVFLNFRNNLFMLAKNVEGFWPGKLFIRMALDGLAAIQFLVTGKPLLFWKVFLAHMAFYGALPYLIGKRTKTKHPVFGMYKGNIVIDYFLKKKNKYSNLNL